MAISPFEKSLCGHLIKLKTNVKINYTLMQEIYPIPRGVVDIMVFYKIHEMVRVVGKLSLGKLTSIVSKNKELDCIPKGYFAPGETTRFASQSSQIMSQVCIGTFNRVRFAFIIHWVMNSRPVENRFVALVIITVVIMALNTLC